MKILILTLCFFIAFINFANAGEVYNCIDRNGNKIITDMPQDGMKCVSKGDERESTHTHRNEAIVQDDDYIDGFTNKQTGIIKRAMREWKQRYVCGRSIVVQPFEGSSKDLGNGVQEKVEETAGPGYIKIDPNSKFSIRNTILHAMTHACQRDNPLMLSEPTPFKDGLILGYQGAAIMVKLRNGEQTFFRKMEEGLCERNASFFSGYSVHHRGYSAVGKLARQHFPQGQDLMTLIQNNDVPGMAAIILNKTEASPREIAIIMDIYQKAWSAAQKLPFSSIDVETYSSNSSTDAKAYSSEITAECAEFARAMVDNNNKSEWKEYADKIKSICPGMGFECKTFYEHPEKNKCEPFKLGSERTFFKDTKLGFP